MKTKLVIISETLMDGVGKHIADLMLNLDKTKYEIHVIHSTKRTDVNFIKAKESLKGQVDFYEIDDFVRKINITKDIKSYFKIKKMIKQIKPGIVHCHSSKAGVIGRLVSCRVKVNRCYYTPHGYAAANTNFSNKKRNIYQLIEKFLAKYFTTMTINVSCGEKQFALDNKIIDDNKSKVIYNGISKICEITKFADELKQEIGLNNEDVIIGYVARIDEGKNPYEFINIAKQVISKNTNVKFIWIGDGRLKQSTQQYINHNGLQDKVLLLGFKQNIIDYLNIMDIYLTTSLYEGLPYTLVEASRASLPIVASNVIGNNEVVESEFNGYLYNSQDVDEAVSKLELLIKNEQLRKELGDNGYELFLKDFTIEKMIKAHEEVYTL